MTTAKNFIHQIVTIGDRNITTAETIYTNDSKPKNSMRMYLKFMKNVQYEIFNRTTNEIVIVN
jgi:hypothetical protein